MITVVVHDEETLEKALHMLRTEGSVRYSDEYAYVIVTNPESLEALCGRALKRESIAIVVPRGRESEMENFFTELSKVRRERAREEKRKIREFMAEHPKVVKRIEERLKK